MTFRFQDALRTGIWVGVLLILLTPLVVTERTLFPFVVGKAVYFRSLVEIVFGMWIVLALAEPRYRLPRSWIVWLFALYVVASLASAMAGVSFQRSFWGDFRRMGGVFDLAHWLLFLIVLVSVWRNTAHWRWLLNANLGIALGISILGLAQHFNLRVFDFLFWYMKPTSRLDITFGNATYVAAYALVNSLVALGFLVQSFQRTPREEPPPVRRARRPRRREARRTYGEFLLAWRVFWGLTAALGLWVLTLSGTRGAALGLAAGLLAAGAAYLIWGKRRRIKLGVGVAMALTLLIAALLPLAHTTAPFQALARSNVLLRRIDYTLTFGSSDSSVASRMTIASTGLNAFAQKPLLGWGPENFAVAFDRNTRTQKTPIGVEIADQAHNKPVEELVTKGATGFFLYLLIAGRLLWVVAAAVRQGGNQQPLALFVLAASVGYIVQDLFLFDTSGIFLSFLLLVAWAAGREYPQGTPRECALKEVQGPSGAPLGRGDRRGRTASERVSRDTPPGPQRSEAVGGRDGEFGGLVVIGASLVLVLTVPFLLFWVNYRPYHAAEIFPVQGSSVRGFVAEAQSSFMAFPPLATLGRQFLLDTLAENWSLTPRNDVPAVLEQVEREGKIALGSEPQNPRIYLSLAKVYQSASASSPSLLSGARELIEQAKLLAPGLIGVELAFIHQQSLEEGYPQALTTLYLSVKEKPAKASLLADLRKDMEGKLRRQVGEAEYRCRWEGKPDLTLEERQRIECGVTPSSP
ncbi:MAG: O-antigen ligase family protein [Chloroflexi bacterium]|nr:O-antigen ligase family protein [Chloroflexota bacterium]